jgi:hypothetical protein
MLPRFMPHPNQPMNHQGKTLNRCLLDLRRLPELIGDDILQKTQGLEYLEPIIE